MVYSQSKRGSYVSSISNQFQGGGNKKAGLPHQVGKDSWTSYYLKSHNSLTNYKTTRMPMANISRPIGSTLQPNTYFHIPGTR
jgi:hypothetical protein